MRFNKLMIEAHNKYRALHGMNPLVYDESVALKAQEWANNMNQ